MTLLSVLIVAGVAVPVAEHTFGPSCMPHGTLD